MAETIQAVAREYELKQVDVLSILDIDHGLWINLVNVPDGQGRIVLGDVGVATPDFSVNNVAAAAPFDGSEGNGDARLSQDYVNNQLVLSNIGTFSSQVTTGQRTSHVSLSTNELGINSNTSSAADSHAIQSQFDPTLSTGEESIVVGEEVVQGDMKSDIRENGTVIDKSAVGILNIYVGFKTSVPRGNGTGADLQILDVQKGLLGPLEFLPSLFVHSSEFKGRESFSELGVTSILSRGKNYKDPYALQHNLSFGTPTLPPDKKSVHLVGDSDRNRHLADLRSGWSQFLGTLNRTLLGEKSWGSTASKKWGS